MKKIPLLVALLLCSCIQGQHLILVPKHISLDLEMAKNDILRCFSLDKNEQKVYNDSNKKGTQQ